MGRSPATSEKGAEMKDARKGGPSGTGAANEDPSRSVPGTRPGTKDTKMANPKAVAGDNEKLATEVCYLTFLCPFPLSSSSPFRCTQQET